MSMLHTFVHENVISNNIKQIDYGNKETSLRDIAGSCGPRES